MKKRFLYTWVAFVCKALPATASAAPIVFPTGTTICKPKKCWNG